MCYGIIPRIFHIGARWVLVVSVTEAGCLPVGQSLLYPLISLCGSQGSSWPYDREENLLSAIIIQHQFLGRGAPSLDGKHTEICSLFFCGTQNISSLYLDSCFTHSRSDVLQQHKISNTNLKQGLTSFRRMNVGTFSTTATWDTHFSSANFLNSPMHAVSFPLLLPWRPSFVDNYRPGCRSYPITRRQMKVVGRRCMQAESLPGK